MRGSDMERGSGIIILLLLQIAHRTTLLNSKHVFLG